MTDTLKAQTETGNLVDLLFVGHFARDRIVVDGNAETASGGGVYFGAIAARRAGMTAAVATRLHPDDMEALAEIRREGIKVCAAEADATSGIENVYDSRDMERRVCTPIAFAGPIRAEDILASFSPKIIAIVPIMAGEVDLALLTALAHRAPVALDVQGFVRVRRPHGLVFEPWPDMNEGLAHVTYLKTDRAEAELLTETRDLEAAARTLAALGPEEIVITESRGVTVYAEGKIHKAPFTPKKLDGRTGRGDTCFATYLARRLNAPAEEATRFAAAVTTLKQEIPGPWNGDLKAAEALMQPGFAS